MSITPGTRLAASVVACLALAACGATSTQGPAASTTPAAVSRATAEPTGSPAPTSSPADAALVALPESVLHPIKGLTYKRITADDTPPEAMTVMARESQGAVTGFIGRSAVEPKSGTIIAVVQVIRLSPDLSAKDLAEYRSLLVEGFTAGAKTTDEKIGGRRALVATSVREQKVGVIAVLDDRDVVFFTSPSLKALRRAAGLYYS